MRATSQHNLRSRSPVSRFPFDSNFNGSLEAGQIAVAMAPDLRLSERVERLWTLAITLYYVGRLEEVEALVPDLESAATGARHRGALWAHERQAHEIPFRILLDWAIRGGYVDAPPFKRGTETVVKLAKGQPRSRRLNPPQYPDEEKDLLADCGPHLRAIVVAAVETGMRSRDPVDAVEPGRGHDDRRRGCHMGAAREAGPAVGEDEDAPRPAHPDQHAAQGGPRDAALRPEGQRARGGRLRSSAPCSARRCRASRASGTRPSLLRLLGPSRNLS